MKRMLAAAAALAIAATACIGGGGNERTILVDYSHDEFASIMVANFPDAVEVVPGTTLVFRQTWTGEPHTVTGGTLVDEYLEESEPWENFFAAFNKMSVSAPDLPSPDDPKGTFQEFLDAVDGADPKLRVEFFDAYDALVERGTRLPDRRNPGDATFKDLVDAVDEQSEEFDQLPWAIDERDDGTVYVAQNVGRPCYLTDGGPPKRSDRACPERQREQPPFDGSHSYYNSGIIPYEGPQGNTFRVELTPDIEPGTYSFYCAVHGPAQKTVVTVKPAGSDVPSQEEVNRLARKQISEFAEPLVSAYRDARDGRFEVNGTSIRAPFAGVSAPVFGFVNEFIPKTITTKVGEPVTWKFMGWDHTVSFGVPEYFPVIRFADDGTVAFNRRLWPPAGGSPPVPEQEGRGILRVDGGTYDGEGFFSSGLIGSEPFAEYTLRFSKPGTYRYACLLHPPMVGTVEVTG